MAGPTADEFISDYEDRIKDIQAKMRDVLSPVPDVPGTLYNDVTPSNPLVVLVNIAKAMGLLTHSATDDVPYIRIPGEGWRRPKFLGVRTREFRELLLSTYFREFGDGVPSEIATQAIDIISGLCMQARPYSRSPKKFVTKK